jgi:biotin carboxyl carrier protein
VTTQDPPINTERAQDTGAAMTHAPSRNVLLALLARAHQSASLAELSRVLTQDLQLLLPADYIALLHLEGDPQGLSAIASREPDDDPHTLQDLALWTARQADDRHEIVVMSADGRGSGLDPDALARAGEQLRKAELRAAITLPLLQNKQLRGTLLLAYRRVPPPSRGTLEASARVAPILAAALHAQSTKSSRSPASRRKRRWALALILGLLSLIPLPFRVGGEARLEARRPFSCYIGTQARVSEILVHDGQIVQAGQVLARLDPRELNFEIRSLERKLSKAQAETQILANQASLSPAHEAERVLAELQQERVAEELRHARSRRRLLELRAPVAGVVVRSGLKGLEGRLFRAGEALCDIAPSTQLRAVVRIPEADFSRVRVGQELELRLRSKPGLAITSPIAELQARIEYDPELGGVLVIRSETIPGTEELRTGMRGTAWVELGWRPAGFILFRRLWTRLRAALLFAG